jgi:hypothetical protein
MCTSRRDSLIPWHAPNPTASVCCALAFFYFQPKEPLTGFSAEQRHKPLLSTPPPPPILPSKSTTRNSNQSRKGKGPKRKERADAASLWQGGRQNALLLFFFFFLSPLGPALPPSSWPHPLAFPAQYAGVGRSLRPVESSTPLLLAAGSDADSRSGPALGAFRF